MDFVIPREFPSLASFSQDAMETHRRPKVAERKKKRSGVST